MTYEDYRAMKLSQKRVADFRQMIFAWWQKNHRNLPWRHTRDPYHILVAEVMLQQTQVCRVLPKYAEFLSAFPSVETLAVSSLARVLTVWRGMGYNRRALYLRKAAEAVVNNHQGRFPKDELQLTKLPGLGTYTARALLVFAYGQDVAMVDTNIRQIITHFFFKGLPQKEKIIQDIADQLLPPGKSWAWHQALMDYGALEMSKIKGKRSSARKQSVPFKDSNRFYRGRIMDHLREGKKNERRLITRLRKNYGNSHGKYADIVNGLIKDGLAVRRGEIIQLPQ